MRPVLLPPDVIAMDDRMWRSDPELPGWLTNGFIAAFVGSAAPVTAEAAAPLKKKLAELSSAERFPVTEAADMRMPYRRTEKNGACFECHGNSRHECECGDEHTCGVCDGSGTYKDVDQDVGQRVYLNGDCISVVDARFGALLDGLKTFRIGKGDMDPIAGVDDAGDVVAIVMPRRDTIRTPAAIEAAP